MFALYLYTYVINIVRKALKNGKNIVRNALYCKGDVKNLAGMWQRVGGGDVPNHVVLSKDYPFLILLQFVKKNV